MEHWWNDSDGGKLKYWDRNLSQCHFAHHEYLIQWPGIEPRPQRQASNHLSKDVAFIQEKTESVNGTLQRTDDQTPRKYTKPTFTKKRPKRRPKARWKDDVENDIRKMGFVNWRQVAQDRDGWNRATREVLIFLHIGVTEDRH
jgi:hypothetical protein